MAGNFENIYIDDSDDDDGGGDDDENQNRKFPNWGYAVA